MLYKTKATLLCLVIIGAIYAADVYIDEKTIVNNLLESLTRAKEFNGKVVFCPSDCITVLADFVNTHDETYCAFYDLDEEIYTRFDAKVQIIVDAKTNSIKQHNVKRIHQHNLMHHKFCVANNTVLLGSTNPTLNGLEKNWNDILTIKDQKFADFFLDEWLYLNETIEQRPSRHNESTVVACLSPQGNCLDLYINTLLEAERSIKIAAFSFTHPRITPVLTHLKEKGINITVALEKQQCSTHCLGPQLREAEIPVFLENTSAKLHHKFAIIDESTILTGSMNPSKNGNNRNNENLVIIRDKTLAKAYFARFEALKVYTAESYDT